MMFLEQTITDKSESDDIALIEGNRQLSYRQLNQNGRKIRNKLRQFDLENDSKIAVYMEKSIEAVTAIYGVLFQGYTYIPIDYSLPRERVLYILENSGAGAVISDEAGFQKLQLDRTMCGICIGTMDVSVLYTDQFEVMNLDATDEDWETCDCVSHDRDDSSSLAYMIYTSGSTGTPKGVMIPHKSIMTFVKDIEETMHYEKNTRFLNVAPLYFDASVLDVFCILNVGGTVVLQKKFMFPKEILKSMETYQITDTLLVSSVLKLLTSKFVELDKYDLSHLKTIWYGAEGCSVRALRILKKSLPNISFIHGYGPTETTHTALWYRFKEIPEDIDGYMPIGIPMPSVSVYALNKEGNLVKPGEYGELYIGGKQLMRGYCNNEAKTSEVLCSNRFHPDRMVYKTGDIVTLDKEGKYWYIGRNDDMVKCGGNLVHLSEIEKVIRTYRTVKDTVICTIEDAIFGKKILAAVVLNDNAITEVNDLREYILEKLPVYMLPSKIQFFSDTQIPRKDSGKVDKLKLSAMFS